MQCYVTPRVTCLTPLVLAVSNFTLMRALLRARAKVTDPKATQIWKDITTAIYSGLAFTAASRC